MTQYDSKCPECGEEFDNVFEATDHLLEEDEEFDPALISGSNLPNRLPAAQLGRSTEPILASQRSIARLAHTLTSSLVKVTIIVPLLS